MTIDGIVKVLVPLWTGLGGLGGLAALVVGLLYVRQHRRNLEAQGGKTEAEAAEVVTGAAVELLGPLRHEIAAARNEAAEARNEAAAARRETAAVRQELSDMDAKARALMRALTQAQDENTVLREQNTKLADELARRRRSR